MFKKAIGLVALVGAAATMAVAGCSTEINPTPDAAATAATSTTDASSATDTGVKRDATAPASCEQNISGKAAEVKSAIDDETNGFGKYKSTLPSAGQCTAANIASFKDYLKNLPSGATYDDVIKKLTEISPDCATCTFKAQTGANWGPFVTVKTSSGGTGAFSNEAGCYEAQGVSTACATAIHYFTKCSLVSCGQCAEADFDQCESDTYDTGGQCATEFGPGIASACQNDAKFQAAGAICEKQGESLIVNLMTGACGPVSTDAGGGG
jgi:hypothetical protein